MRFLISVLFTLSFTAWTAGAVDKDLFGSERPNVLAAKDLAGLKLISPTWATAHVLQFGESSNDVLYLIFDTTDELHASDRLHLYSPVLRDFKHLTLEKGTRTRRQVTSSRSEYYYRFSPIRFEGEYGRTDVSYVMLIRSMADEIELLMTCSLEKSGRRSRFLLSRRFTPTAVSSPVTPVDQILAEPELIVGLDNRAKQSRIVTRLRMGGYSMLPVSGMKTRLELEVTDHKTARFRFSERIKLDESSFEDGYKLVPSKRLMPGRTYLVNVLADLGDILGERELSTEVVPTK